MSETNRLPTGTEVLVFAVVALNSNWKILLGYFLLHGLTALQKTKAYQPNLTLTQDLSDKYT